jgi:hypothetical protein
MNHSDRDAARFLRFRFRTNQAERMMFLLWSVVDVDFLPAAFAAILIAVAHRSSRTPRAFHVWARALSILGAQLVFVAVLMALLLTAILSFPDYDVGGPRPVPLTAYLAAVLWCAGPTLTGLALRAASRSLRRKAERTVSPIEIEAFS